MEEGAAQMMFIELLFWKSAATSEEVGQRYNWLVGPCNACGAVCPVQSLLSNTLYPASSLGV